VRGIGWPFIDPHQPLQHFAANHRFGDDPAAPVLKVLIAECFLSVSRLPESMYFGCAGCVSRIHSHAAHVALPVMFLTGCIAGRVVEAQVQHVGERHTARSRHSRPLRVVDSAAARIRSWFCVDPFAEVACLPRQSRT